MDRDERGLHFDLAILYTNAFKKDMDNSHPILSLTTVSNLLCIERSRGEQAKPSQPKLASLRPHNDQMYGPEKQLAPIGTMKWLC